MNPIVSMFTILLLFPLCISAKFINTQYTNSSGIFYNHLGNVSITNSKLTLLTFLNVSYLHNALSSLESQHVRTKIACDIHNTKNSFCKEPLKIIKAKITNINDKSVTLSHIVGYNEDDTLYSRVKRGLINGVSYGFNWLFGVPDAEDAKFYTESINNLINDNKQTKTVLKNQIQVISSTIDSLNKSIAYIQNGEIAINENIEKFNKMSRDISETKLELLFEQQISLLSAAVDKLSYEFDNYINTINLGKHGIVSPQILTPKILYDELQIYHGQDDLFIGGTYKNIHLFYKVLTMNIAQSDDLIIFAFKVPLKSENIYSLYNLIPLPMQNKNNSVFTYIEPKSPYLLLSISKTYFSLLPSISHCQEYMTGEYLCEDIHLNRRNDLKTCEVTLMSPHVENIPDDCQIHTIHAEIETWKFIGNN